MWDFLNTDVGDSYADAVQQSSDLAKAALGALKKVGEHQGELQKVVPEFRNISSLLEILQLPLVEIVGESLPLISVVAKIVKFYHQRYQENIDFCECILLVSQAAYLKSFLDLFNQSSTIKENINSRIPASFSIKHAIEEYIQSQQGKDFSFELKEAENLIVCFHESEVAGLLKSVLSRRLEDAGLEPNTSQIFAERVCRKTPYFMFEAFAENQTFSSLIERYFSLKNSIGWNRRQFSRIEKYLSEQISSKSTSLDSNPSSKWNVFEEDFTIKDIYVPLTAAPIESNEGQKESDSLELEDWAKNILFNPNKRGKVMFIQAGPGRGKSVFCKVFADWVYTNLYPIWIPVLIKLRYLGKIRNHLEETLATAINYSFAKEDEWLHNRNYRFLFLLDGFDELLMEGRKSGGLEDFLGQIGTFQKCCDRDNMGHKVLVTGRTLSLKGIERQLPNNLSRVKINPMDLNLQLQWLDKWSEVNRKVNSIEELKTFLRSNSDHKNGIRLAQEPLILYLLAAMHRDGKLNIRNFVDVHEPEARTSFYEDVLKWVLSIRFDESDSGRYRQESRDVIRILEEAALCVAQTGTGYTSMQMVEHKLRSSSSEKSFERIQKKIRTSPSFLRNSLTAFYVQSGSRSQEAESPGGNIEFTHTSFSDFLYAKRIFRDFSRWVKIIQDEDDEDHNFAVNNETLNYDIYKLLGHGPVSIAVIRYLVTITIAEWTDDTTKLETVFERLNNFYFQWSHGSFIGIGIPTLPQKAALHLKEHGLKISQEKVDIFTGLNILSILFNFSDRIRRNSTFNDQVKSRLKFFPCGNPNDKPTRFEPKRLLKIVGYSHCISSTTFVEIVGKFLRSANLRNIDLNGVDFHGADLREADLSGAELSRINLRGANLCSANLRGSLLQGAYMSRADLSEAILEDANLRRAYLNRVNLQNSKLENADFRGAHLSNTHLRGAFFGKTSFESVQIKWGNAIGIHEINGIPSSLSEDKCFKAASALSDGRSLACQGKIEEAIQKYNDAQEIDENLTISASFWNKLAWLGSLHDHAHQVLHAAIKANEMESDSGNYIDTLAVAQALCGHVDEAIRNFEKAIVLDGLSEEDKNRRKIWLRKLKMGINPFSSKELESLRENELKTIDSLETE